MHAAHRAVRVCDGLLWLIFVIVVVIAARKGGHGPCVVKNPNERQRHIMVPIDWRTIMGAQSPKQRWAIEKRREGGQWPGEQGSHQIGTIKGCMIVCSTGFTECQWQKDTH